MSIVLGPGGMGVLVSDGFEPLDSADTEENAK